MINKTLKIAAGIIIISLSSSAFAKIEIASMPLSVSFFVNGGVDQTMNVTFNAAGTYDCSQPIPPGTSGVCQQVGWNHSTNPPLEQAPTAMKITQDSYSTQPTFPNGISLYSTEPMNPPSGTFTVTYTATFTNHPSVSGTRSMTLDSSGNLEPFSYYHDANSDSTAFCDVFQGTGNSIYISCNDT